MSPRQGWPRRCCPPLEDVTSVGLVFLAILVPVLVAVVALVWAVLRIVRRRRKAGSSPG
jgi:hypothetical protein